MGVSLLIGSLPVRLAGGFLNPQREYKWRFHWEVWSGAPDETISARWEMSPPLSLLWVSLFEADFVRILSATNQTFEITECNTSSMHIHTPCHCSHAVSKQRINS